MLLMLWLLMLRPACCAPPGLPWPGLQDTEWKDGCLVRKGIRGASNVLSQVGG